MAWRAFVRYAHPTIALTLVTILVKGLFAYVTIAVCTIETSNVYYGIEVPSGLSVKIVKNIDSILIYVGSSIYRLQIALG